jgi:gamma-glutamylcyclotransferase (GGCT)/AIG2-like uncharacterized protein YtfP
MSDPAPLRLFVYGTLKRGYCRHHALATEQFLGEAHTAPFYRMFNVGTYPGLVEADGNGLSIHGEVWEVSPAALSRLDEVEGTAEGQYARRVIHLAGDPFGPVEAYFYLWPIADCPDCGERWI